MIHARLRALGLLAVSAVVGYGSQPSTPVELSVADAVTILESDLVELGIDGTVAAAEEGSFMLGAYPRASVLWHLRLSDQPSIQHMEDLATRAAELREGWVWISVGDGEGGVKLHAFPDQSGEGTESR